MEKIKNLLKFNLVFSKFTNGSISAENVLLKSSPDYIIEKFKNFLGFDPIYKEIELTLDEQDFLIEYNKIWNNIEHKNILIYLINTGNLNVKTIYANFEKYIGDFDMITSNTTKGLHHKIEKDILDIIVFDNSKYFEMMSRDIKLNSLLKNKIN